MKTTSKPQKSRLPPRGKAYARRKLDEPAAHYVVAIGRKSLLRSGICLVVLSSLLFGFQQTDHKASRNLKFEGQQPQSQNQTSLAVPDPPQKKYAIYMTTHLSKQHIDFLTLCWPAALERLPLLQQADFIVYTSRESEEKIQVLQRVLGNTTVGNRVIIRRYEEGNSNETRNDLVPQQEGAVTAMVDPYLPENQNWFQGYEWIIRLNPDVLIRRDEWLLETMQNDALDAIVIRWQRNKWRSFPLALHTDFYAFRPGAVNGTALVEKYREQRSLGEIHAESHIAPGFRHLIDAGRVVWLPNATENKVYARTRGPHCPVVHDHRLYHHCPNYFDVIM